MDQYIQYIEDSLEPIAYQDSLSSLKVKQDFCSEYSENYSQLWALVPYASFGSNGTSDVLENLINTLLNKLLQADFFFLSMFLTITITGLVILKSYKKSRRVRSKERRGFTRLIKCSVLKRQNYKCGHCRKFLTAVDFHHKNRDRSDNRERNCQALCPNCHAIETRGLLK